MNIKKNNIAFVESGILAAEGSFWKKLMVGIQFESGGMKVQPSVSVERNDVAVRDIDEVLQIVPKSLSKKSLGSYTFRTGPPVLVIDEANKLKTLAEEDPAVGYNPLLPMICASNDFVLTCCQKQSFKSFLEFVVRETKEESNMHVIFTSSDSFFEQWLIKSGGLSLSF